MSDPWKHRSAGMTCATCMWSVIKVRTTLIQAGSQVGKSLSPDELDREPLPVLGRCRRRAPTMNGYPAIFQTDWCGDHKLDENKI